MKPFAEKEPSPQDLICDLEGLCERWFRPQIDRLREGRTRPRPKVLNDPVWGSIRLHPWEVALLDTGLMQRLRFLKQLGVAHWVFPGAGHSRLEHSLGVLHQIQALVEGVERNSGRAGERLISDADVYLLRIAALVHDCGHAVMSHVSERFVDELPGIKGLVRLIQSTYRPRKPPSSSEAIAAVFVRSSAFQEFIAMKEVGADFIRDAREASERIAGFLVGGPMTPSKEFMTLLINGPFDADKLDYMPRDAQMAGVPCAVDVRRVIEKIQCLPVPEKRVADSYRGWAKAADGVIWVLALSKSGARALHELAVTRTFLYDKVYYHHKVRALEVVARRLLEEKSLKHGVRRLVDWLLLSDESIVLDDSLDNARILRDRVLPKRAFLIIPPDSDGKDDPVDPAQGDLFAKLPQGSRANWMRLRGHYRDGTLTSRIQSTADEFSKALNGRPLSFRSAVDYPDLTKLGIDQHAFVGDGPDDFAVADTPISGERPETAKRIARAGYYVFAAEEDVLPTFLATRAVLADDYGQTYDSSCYAATKLDLGDIRSAEELLKKKGLLGAIKEDQLAESHILSHKAQRLETFLRTAWPRLEALSIRFNRYQAPQSLPISPQRLAAFLRQTGELHLARPALRMLEAVEFKDRDYFAKALDRLLRDAKSHGPLDLVSPLGGSGDSSSLLLYLMADVSTDVRQKVQGIELALEAAPKCLLLWDEFCGLGSHARTTLAQWLGVTGDSEDALLDEDLVPKLSDQRAGLFRQTRILIGFAMGTKTGINSIRAFCKKYGISNVTCMEPLELVQEEDELFTSKSKILADQTEREALRDFLSGIGKKLLLPNVSRATKPWAMDVLENRVLGYGNWAKLLVFYYNTPTASVTALWKSGDGWSALFPRRQKPSRE